jgi:hypothetical protein
VPATGRPQPAEIADVEAALPAQVPHVRLTRLSKVGFVVLLEYDGRRTVKFEWHAPGKADAYFSGVCPSYFTVVLCGSVVGGENLV